MVITERYCRTDSENISIVNARAQKHLRNRDRIRSSALLYVQSQRSETITGGARV